MTTYPGGKNGSGVYQKIINLMPPHKVYIEAFAGSAAILRNKRPAPIASIAVDIDAGAIAALSEERIEANLVLGDALRWLRMTHYVLDRDTLIYLDPPYLGAVRSSGRAIYTHEMMDEARHRELIGIIRELPCMVIISGYYSDLYANLLYDWRAVSFGAQTRGGRKIEWCWMNYPEPTELHDYRYLGDDFRSRERIKRRQARWKNRLLRMDSKERYALLSVIEELWSRG